MPNDVKNISGNLIKQPAEEFQVRSATSAVGFDTDNAPPPPGMYVGVDDLLFVQCASFALTGVIVINLRILRPDGIIVPMQVTCPTFSNRAFLPARFALMEGWILSASATGTNIISNVGWAYLSVSIQRNPLTLLSQFELLMAGYLNSNVPLSYPVSVPQRTTDGAGTLRSITGSVPAAGADISEAVPGSVRWRLVSFRATLVTSAAAGNRLVSIVLDDGANIYAESVSNFTQITGITNTYNAFDSAPYVNVPFNLRTMQPLPSNQFLTQSNRLRTATAGILAGDQWTAPQYQVIEWLENQ